MITSATTAPIVMNLPCAFGSARRLSSAPGQDREQDRRKHSSSDGCGRYHQVMASREARIVGLLRCAVGVAFLGAPRVLFGLTSLDDATGVTVFLMRTKGIRDLAIGAGTVAASISESSKDCRRWILASLGSDGLDGVAAFLSQWSIGRPEALLTAGTAAAFAGLDRWALRSLTTTPPKEGERLSSS